MPAPSPISQAEIGTIRDQAIELARFPEAAIDGGGISHAASYTLGESLVVVEILDLTGDSDPNPMFSVVQILRDSSVEPTGLERDFTFTPAGSSRKVKYNFSLHEDMKVFDDKGKAITLPLEVARTPEERKAYRDRRSEIDQLHKALGHGELTRDKVQELIRAIGGCGTWNLAALGEEALSRRGYHGN